MCAPFGRVMREPSAPAGGCTAFEMLRSETGIGFSGRDEEEESNRGKRSTNPRVRRVPELYLDEKWRRDEERGENGNAETSIHRSEAL